MTSFEKLLLEELRTLRSENNNRFDKVEKKLEDMSLRFGEIEVAMGCASAQIQQNSKDINTIQLNERSSMDKKNAAVVGGGVGAVAFLITIGKLLGLI